MSNIIFTHLRNKVVLLFCNRVLLLIQLKASRLSLKYLVIYNRICMTILIIKKNVKCSCHLRPSVVFHFLEY